jgi:hypothetical protein
MDEHSFLLKEGEWEGSGEISLTISSEKLPFTVTWHIKKKENFFICQQKVYVEGNPVAVSNMYTINEIDKETFLIELSGTQVGHAYGKGVFDTSKIAWEFSGESSNIQGFEVYKRVANEEYLLHAEYASEDMRTIVHGTIRPKKNR